MISYSFPTTLRQIPPFSLKIRYSLEVLSYRVNRARNSTYFAKSNRIKIFLFAPPPPPHPRDRTPSNNSPIPGPKGWTCHEGCPGRIVTNKIEPCITTAQINPRHKNMQISLYINQFHLRINSMFLETVCLFVYSVHVPLLGFCYL